VEEDLPPRPSATPSSRYSDAGWKPRVDHPKELDDGVEPTWITWKLNMEHKFEEDAPQFATERSRIRYMFSKTKGKANRLLQPYMSPKCPVPFTTVDEVYMALEELLTNPGEVEEAKEQFRELQMARNQPFSEFKMEFLQLAGLAEIPRTAYVDELYNKLTDKLKDALALPKYKWGTDFALASKEIQQTDTRFTLNAKQRQRARAAAGSRADTATPMTSKRSSWKSDPTPTQTQTRFRQETTEPTSRLRPILGRPLEGRYSTPHLGVDSQIKCHNCGRNGHVRRNCDQPEQPGSIREMAEEEELSDEDQEDESGKEEA
jgi:hypothetical protein